MTDTCITRVPHRFYVLASHPSTLVNFVVVGGHQRKPFRQFKAEKPRLGELHGLGGRRQHVRANSRLFLNFTVGACLQRLVSLEMSLGKGPLLVLLAKHESKLTGRRQNASTPRQTRLDFGRGTLTRVGWQEWTRMCGHDGENRYY